MKKPVGVEELGETASLTGEFVGEIHRVLECIQTHPAGNQRQKGPICWWVAEEVTESWQSAEQGPLFPLGLLPHNAATGEYLWLHPLLHRRAIQKNMAQMKDHIKVPEK